METNPRRWIGALRGAQDRLASLVKPLTPEQLRGPSYHSWSIAQVLGRLGSQAEIYMGWIGSARLTHGAGGARHDTLEQPLLADRLRERSRHCLRACRAPANPTSSLSCAPPSCGRLRLVPATP